MKKVAKKVVKTPSVPSSNAWMIQDKALKEMERGMNHLHRQNYTEALAHFQSLVEDSTQQRELVDRAQVYVRICKSMLERKPVAPKKPEDLFYLGVIKANQADYVEAADLLDRALQANPKDEKAHYVLASTLALKGDRPEALRHLKEAIDLNATNRVYAMNDPDFEPIREDEGFQNLIHPEEI
jgi:tetratricopeptide (TPR) repeat protein